MSDGLPDGVSLQELEPDAFIAQLDTIIGIYESAKGVSANRIMMTRHAACSGFRCIIARYDDDIIGFIYGMQDGRETGFRIPGSPVAWGSHDLLSVSIADGKLPQCWADAFDIAEVHVLPVWQGKRIGTKLIYAICADLRAGKVILIVDRNSCAHEFYRRLRFDDLPNPQWRVYLMGRSLPLLDK